VNRSREYERHVQRVRQSGPICPAPAPRRWVVCAVKVLAWLAAAAAVVAMSGTFGRGW
jgi:hypothetical protein